MDEDVEYCTNRVSPGGGKYEFSEERLVETRISPAIISSGLLTVLLTNIKLIKNYYSEAIKFK
jgi:hypothetical protein